MYGRDAGTNPPSPSCGSITTAATCSGATWVSNIRSSRASASLASGPRYASGYGAR